MAALSRRQIAQHVADQLVAGKASKPLLRKIAAYLVQHKLVGQAELLVRDIESILARDHGVVMAEVISARELSKGLIKNIEQFVAKMESARTVEVSTSVDPSLLGGVVIKTPRAEIDTTVRKQLNALKA